MEDDVVVAREDIANGLGSDVRPNYRCKYILFIPDNTNSE